MSISPTSFRIPLFQTSSANYRKITNQGPIQKCNLSEIKESYLDNYRR